VQCTNPSVGTYGSFTVGDNGSGSLVVTGASGACVATDAHTIDFDLTRLAAVTVNGTDIKSGAGYQEPVDPQSYVDWRYGPFIIYYPAGTVQCTNPSVGTYGSFTVGDNGSGSLVVTGASGACVATDAHTIDFDLSKLAAITVNGTDIRTAAGQQEQVYVQSYVDWRYGPFVIYYPAGTVQCVNGSGASYGSFTITYNGSGSFAISSTTGALVASGNTIDFDTCKLNQIQITANSGIPWGINGVSIGTSFNDIVAIPDGSYALGFEDPSGNFTFATFSVGPSGLSATQLPQNNPLVSLQLVPCQDATTTTVTAPVNPSMLNQTVTFTANVSAPDGDVPTGTVQFLIDGVNFGSPVTLANGSAGITTAGLSAGPHTIQAVYGGNSDFLGSNGTLTQNVQYCFDGFLPPLSQNLAFAFNRTIPIKWQLCDFNGTLITSLSAVTSLQVAPVNSDNSLGTPFNPTPAGGTSLRNDGSQYIFNWQTKGLAAGTYEILLTLSDGTLHIKVLQLSQSGSSAGLTTVVAGGTGTALGALLGGNVDLYVDNSNGDLTTDELARIQDAVTAVDAVTEPYGVAVAEVTDPTLADVTLNMDITSAVGGYADGVLGCTTDAGQITVISGWNFYAGSDPPQIGAGQYDFETVITHELGHALGLGHSADSTSVMYATLNTGTVNRNLTTADLNVPDSDTTGACGLHAMPQPASSAEPGTHSSLVRPGLMPGGAFRQAPVDASGKHEPEVNGPGWRMNTFVPPTPEGALPHSAASSQIVTPNWVNASAGPWSASPIVSGGEAADDTLDSSAAPPWPSPAIPVTDPETLESSPQFCKPAIDLLLASVYGQQAQSASTAEKLSARAADVVFANHDGANMQRLPQAVDDVASVDSGWVWAAALAGLMTPTIRNLDNRSDKSRGTVRP
jgi:hypothetical protein